jgi:hypothetical protein
MKTTSKIIATVAATLALATAGAVLAQPGYGPGMGYGPGGGMGYGPGGGMGYGPGMGGGPGMGPGAMGGTGYGHGMGRGMGRGMGGGFDTPAVAAARMADLKAQLKITSGQEAAWKSYETAATQQAATMQTMHALMQSQFQSGAQLGTANPDFASQRLALMAQRDAARAASSAALRDLYAALTPEQRTLMGYGQFAGGPRGPRGPAR